MPRRETIDLDEFSGQLAVKLSSCEDPDWDFARTKRCALLVPSGEWVQSVFSVAFESAGKTLIAPNRDSPYEGFAAYCGNENWKFIDCIAIGVRDAKGCFLRIEAKASSDSVIVTPWIAKYLYTVFAPRSGSSDLCEIPLEVTYCLLSKGEETSVSGYIRICSPSKDRDIHRNLTIIVQPFMDNRHVFDRPISPNGYSSKVYGTGRNRVIRISRRVFMTPTRPEPFTELSVL